MADSSSPDQWAPPSLPAGEEHFPTSIVHLAFSHLETAIGLDDPQADSVYLQHDSLPLPEDQAAEADPSAKAPLVVVLLTRDGETPEFEEEKEHILLSFRADDDGRPLVWPEFPVVWIDYVSEDGEVSHFSANLSAVVENPQSLVGEAEPEKARARNRLAGLKRGKKSLPLTPKRLRDLVQGFRVTAHFQATEAE